MRPPRFFLAAFASTLVLSSVACGSGSSSSTPPTISNLMIPSPIAAGAAITCTVDAVDTAGLEGLTADFTLSTKGQPLGTLSAPVQGGTAATQALITLGVLTTIPAGTYDVVLTLSEGSAKSNPLTGSFVIQ